jgi:hypothetical protein
MANIIPSGTSAPNIVIDTSLSSVIDNATNYFLGYFPILATFMLFYAGFLFITSYSDDRLSQSKNVTLSVIGAYAMVALFKPIKGLFEGIKGDSSIKGIFSQIETTITSILSELIGVLEYLAGAVGLFLFILAGYKLILSFGNQDKLKEVESLGIGVAVSLVIIAMSRGFLVLFNNEKFSSNFDTSGIVATITNLLNIALSFAGTVAVAYIIYGAYKIMFAAEGEADDGKKIITHSLIGLAIVMMSMAITNIIFSYTTGI